MNYYTTTTDRMAAMARVTAARVSYSSRAADELTLAVALPPDSYEAPLPWEYGDRVNLTNGLGRVVFSGTVEPPTLDPMAREWRCTVRGLWRRLETVTYANMSAAGKLRFPATFSSVNESALLTKVTLPQAGGPPLVQYMLPAEAEEYLEEHPTATLEPARAGGLVSAADVATGVCDWAGVPADMPVTACVLEVGSTGATSCASLLLSALEMVPGAVTWTDYTATTPTLICRHADDLPLLSLDLATGSVSGLGSTGGVVSYSFQPRPDLVPPVVAILCGDECPLVLPEGGDIRTPGAFLTAIAPLKVSRGSSATTAGGELTPAMAAAVQRASGQYVRVRALPLPGNTAANAIPFWQRFFPWLKGYASAVSTDAAKITRLTKEEAFPDADDMVVTGIPAADESAEINNYSTACDYLLIQGDIPTHKRTGIKFCRGSIEQRVWLTNPNAVAPEIVTERGRHFPGNAERSGTETLYVDLALTDAVLVDRRTYVYQNGTNIEPEAMEEGGGAGGGTTPPAEEEPSTEELEHAAELAYTALACRDYYNATRTERPEISLELFCPEFCPADLLGYRLQLVNGPAAHNGRPSPVLGVTWDLLTGRVGVSCGSGSEANFNAMLSQRRALSARNNAVISPTADVTAADFSGYDPTAGEGGEEAEQETPYNMISPSISGSAGAGEGGQARYPFQVFEEGGKWYMYRAEIPVPGGMLQFPTTEVPYKEGRKFSVLQYWTGSAWSYKVRYYDTPTT